ncbi:lipopolysaccharide biosynthesis protein [Fundicoccus culcitae]|uniref:Oligosaccharide flippase family protein n=1 Tax=Fundicoccus culcitae TaxID=2969821 RepID=A0ABY5P908_9LACT|nr:oligosaccharide flippase family protein [Fundicoccus culcitae]UUX35237.1 oligosaccharide flippase family protein [Fundicoccus culcitae]
MSRYKKLLNNSIIFTIGNFGSKLINLFMVPLYTNVLTTSEYGTVDLIITTIGLLVPFFSLSLGHAALRFTIDATSIKDKQSIFNNISLHGLLASLILLLLYPLINSFSVFSEYGIYFVLLMILNLFNDLYSQFVRGVGLVKQYAINGIIMTLVTVSTNLLLLVVFDFGINGYIISLIIAVFISNLYLLFSISNIINLIPKFFDVNLYKEMLSFSIPIIPNTVMWWLINGSTRYFLLYFVGTAANGLFAVANKIPSIISMVTNIFMQAWQLSSFEEYNSSDKDKFYSTIFNGFSTILFIVGSGILVILKPALRILVEQTFYESWTIVPFLIIGVIYQSFSAFLGTNYTASKNTKGTFTTSLYGGVVSVVSSLVLIPTIGTIGAGISTALSFIIMFVLRYVDTKKFVTIDFDNRIFLGNNLILFVQIVLLFIFEGILLIVLELICFILLILINKSLLNTIYEIFVKRIIKAK